VKRRVAPLLFLVALAFAVGLYLLPGRRVRARHGRQSDSRPIHWKDKWASADCLTLESGRGSNALALIAECLAENGDRLSQVQSLALSNSVCRWFACLEKGTYNAFLEFRQPEKIVLDPDILDQLPTYFWPRWQMTMQMLPESVLPEPLQRAGSDVKELRGIIDGMNAVEQAGLCYLLFNLSRFDLVVDKTFEVKLSRVGSGATNGLDRLNYLFATYDSSYSHAHAGSPWGTRLESKTCNERTERFCWRLSAGCSSELPNPGAPSPSTSRCFGHRTRKGGNLLSATIPIPRVK